MSWHLRIAGIALPSTGLIVKPALAFIYLVNPQGTGDFPTIQDALLAVQNGDIIELADGEFRRPLGPPGDFIGYDFLGKAITIRSQSGIPENCTVAFYSYGCREAGFVFQSGEFQYSTLENISITSDYGFNVCNFVDDTCRGGAGVVVANGSSPKLVNLRLYSSPVGVRICNSAPQLLGCRFINTGVGLHVVGSSAPFAITSCTFEENDGFISCEGGLGTITGSILSRSVHFGSGGPLPGIELRKGSQVEMDSCLIQQNVGGIAVLESQHTIRNCIITGNAGTGNQHAGVLVGPGSDVTIERSTIAGNRMQNAGGIEAQSTVRIEHSVVWGNCTLGSGEPEVHVGPGGSVTFECTLVDSIGVGGTGFISWVGTNLFTDPIFISPQDCSAAPTSAGDYCLTKASPGRNVPGCGTLGAIFDPCFISLETTSWGLIKSLYR